eukprot:GILK01000988.1.p1 GENE.GILK01000988.1~~GILK01000988.1.p1  ORF type:complete len:508 (+),score=109.41 GILK01000988.1:78-1526(+)
MAASELGIRTQLFINNEFVNAQSGRTIPCRNPANEEIICHVQEADKSDIDKAVAAAREALDNGPWKDIDGHQRGRLLNRLADIVERNAPTLAAIESMDNGKSVDAALAYDLQSIVTTIRYYAGWADKITGKMIPVPGNFVSYTRHEPVGVVGAIVPWNFPLMLLVWKLAPALACGNTLVIKPAEETPLSALKLCEYILEAGFPAGVVNVVVGYGAVAGAALTEHMDVDKIAFTGSSGVGKIIMKAAANSNLKRVTLELGGKSPNVVLEDADIEAAVDGAIGAIFTNMGQNCVAGSRLYIQSSIYEDFLARLKAKAEQIIRGHPMFGPVVNKTQFDKILSYIQYGKTCGARMLCGGGIAHQPGFFIQPTIFADCDETMRIGCEEIFGPVLCVFKFDTFEEVLHRANKTDFGLGSAIWTRDMSKAHKFVQTVKAGTVFINTYNIISAFVPFGGFKQSGYGRDLGEYALHHYTEVKAVTMAVSKL